MQEENREELDIFDLGLTADLEMMKQTAVNRRRFLKMGLANMVALLTGCQASEPTVASEENGAVGTAASGSTGNTSETVSDAEVCVDAIPEETAGPYPADGSQASNATLNALAMAGIVRSDIRTSLGTSNLAQGIPCNFELTLVDSSDDCTPLAARSLRDLFFPG